MTRQPKDGSPKDIEKRIGYCFRDISLLTRALTHASARTRREIIGDNERLEFLGDRVLGLAIAQMLIETFPEAREKDLARRLNALVRTETCAAVARCIDLGPCLILDSGEASAGGRRKDSILADGCEALLGAVFADGGFTEAGNMVRRLWSGFLHETGDAPIDAKTALQEWAQGRKLPLPVYVMVGSQGPDHAPHFTVEARIAGVEPARGEGASKRAAEQSAASAILLREGVWSAS